MTIGEGPGWHREPRRHHDAALKGMERGVAKVRQIARADRYSRKAPKRSRAARQAQVRYPLDLGDGKVSTEGGMYVTTYPTKTVKVGKKEYEIPTGPGGKVPLDAIVSRFLNEYEGDREGGRRNVVIDIDDYAKVQIKKDPTPEEIKKWWAYPNESDVKGIDTPGNSIFQTFAGGTKGSKEAQRTIAVIGGTKEQQEAIRKGIATGFTVKEQRAMRGTTIYITDLRGASGEYHGRTMDGSYVIKIDRRTGTNAETVDHEMIHHLRAVDETREDPLVQGRKSYIGKDRDLEEAATVAETQARHKPYEFQKQMGYYALLKKPVNQKAEDRGLFTKQEVKKTETGNIHLMENPELVQSGRKGKRALKATKDGFESSHIAHLSLDGARAEAIDQWYSIKGKDGKVQNIQVYSPQGVKANVRPRKGQIVYEYRDGKKVKIAGGDR